MDVLINKWKLLPEWSRWILCWPLIVIIPIIVNILYQIFFVSAAWHEGFENPAANAFTPNSFSQFFTGGICIALQISSIFISIFYLVPRGQDIVSAFFTFLFVVLDLLGGAGMIISFNQNEITLLQCIAGVILSIGAGILSVFWSYQIRKSLKGNSDILDRIFS